MKIFYHDRYNIDLGLLNALHPFDGRKFRRIARAIEQLESIDIRAPEQPVSAQDVDHFADALLRLLLKKKRYILRALEVPYLPLIPLSFIDQRVLLPMRWGVAGTVSAASEALPGDVCWNLAGGYHHASRGAAEGFCVYNDIGIAVDALTRQRRLGEHARLLIVDIDAHHGNGNAHVFMDQPNVTILDIYNRAIYPSSNFTRDRVDIAIPLAPGTRGDEYLQRLDGGLARLDSHYDLAFVVAGTDVLASDPLGGLALSIEDCVARDSLVLERMRAHSTPTVFLGGGGYSADSAKATIASLKSLYRSY